MQNRHQHLRAFFFAFKLKYPYICLLKFNIMPTYLPQGNITLNRQEGDNADVVIVVPDILLLDNAFVKFQVWTVPNDGTERTVVFEKDSGTEETDIGGITIDSQTITVEILPDDTKGFQGTHRWECQIQDDDDYGIVTIAKGIFNIMFEIIE